MITGNKTLVNPDIMQVLKPQREIHRDVYVHRVDVYFCALVMYECLGVCMKKEFISSRLDNSSQIHPD